MALTKTEREELERLTAKSKLPVKRTAPAAGDGDDGEIYVLRRGAAARFLAGLFPGDAPATAEGDGQGDEPESEEEAEGDDEEEEPEGDEGQPDEEPPAGHVYFRGRRK